MSDSESRKWPCGIITYGPRPNGCTLHGWNCGRECSDETVVPERGEFDLAVEDFMRAVTSFAVYSIMEASDAEMLEASRRIREARRHLRAAHETRANAGKPSRPPALCQGQLEARRNAETLLAALQRQELNVHKMVPAYQDTSGRIYLGVTHAQALEAAEALNAPIPDGSLGGWLMSNGRYQPQETAASTEAAHAE